MIVDTVKYRGIAILVSCEDSEYSNKKGIINKNIGLFSTESSMGCTGNHETYAQALIAQKKLIEDYRNKIPKTKNEWLLQLGEFAYDFQDDIAWAFLVKASKYLKED